MFVLPIGMRHIVAGYRQRTPDSLASGLVLGPVLLVGTAFAELVGNLHGPNVGAIKAVLFPLARDFDWSRLPRLERHSDVPYCQASGHLDR